MEFDAHKIVRLVEYMERNYSLRPRHPERETVYAGYATRSERFRASQPHWERIAYAPPARCAIECFPAQRPQEQGPAPLLVFIHGGFWRALDTSIFSFVAEAYVRAGVNVALLGYELTPRVSLEQIVAQVAEGMRCLARRSQAMGIDPQQVSVSGHSAGGHLAAMLCAMPPESLIGCPLVAAIPISGVFALEPLLLTSVNHDVRMSAADAVRLSPAHVDAFHVGRFIVAVGADETDGFIGQSRDFSEAAARTGVPTQLELLPRRNHFDVLEDFADPAAPFFQSVLAAVSEPQDTRPRRAHA